MNNKIKIINCCKTFDNNKVGLHDFSLELPTTGIVVLKGNSGSGKTTFMNCLSGLDHFSFGSISINGNQVKNLFEYSSFLFQDNYFIEHLSVFDNLRIVSREKESIICELLDEFSIGDLQNNPISKLSGGERLRVSLIRAIIQDKPIVFLDEPFANIDEDNSKIVCDVIKRFSNQKLFIISSHQHYSIENNASVCVSISDDHYVTFETNDTRIVTNDHLLIKSNKKHLKTSLFFKNILLSYKGKIFKTISNILLLFISFVSISLCLSFAIIDEPYVSYNTYRHNHIDSVAFQRVDLDFNDWLTPTWSSDEEIMNPDFTDITYFSFSLKNNDESVYFRKVRVDHTNSLDDGEAIVYGPEEYSSFFHLAYLDYDIVVKEFIVSDIDNSLLMINDNTYKKIKANIYHNSEIAVENGDGFTGITLYNPYDRLSGADVQTLISGNKPSSENEIVIPQNFASWVNNPNEGVIGKTITFTFVNTSQYRHIEKRTVTETFVVTGISKSLFHFTPELTNYYLGEFGWNSLENGNKAIVFKNYDLSTFRNAKDIGLKHIGETSERIYGSIRVIEGFFPVAVIAASAFSLISLISILLGINTALLKSKKDIGLFICFEVSRLDIAASFAFEAIFNMILAAVLSIPLNFVLVNLFNSLFVDELKLTITLLKVYPQSLLLFVAVGAAITLVSLIVSLFKISKEKRIDVLKSF